MVRRIEPDGVLPSGGSAVSGGEVLHELGQGIATFSWECVVDRGSNTSDRSVPLEIAHRVFRGFREECGREFVTGKVEGDVHFRSAFDSAVAAIETIGIVDRVIDQRSLFGVSAGNRIDSTLIKDPLEDEVHAVDPEYRGGVQS